MDMRALAFKLVDKIKIQGTKKKTQDVLPFVTVITTILYIIRPPFSCKLKKARILVWFENKKKKSTVNSQCSTLELAEFTKMLRG